MDGKLHHFTTTTSTQQEARRLIDDGIARSGDAIVADEQTSGRGRFGRTWISPRGGLYTTIILPSDPLLSLKAGLALANILRAAGVIAGIKWPNDVLVENRKIAGILIEATGDLALVGIGLNLTSAPLDMATCVARYVKDSERDSWARRLVNELVEMTESAFDLDAYRAACVTLGRIVQVKGVGDEHLAEGVALAVDDCGRLVVMTATGERTVSSGECFHVKSHGGAVAPHVENG